MKLIFTLMIILSSSLSIAQERRVLRCAVDKDGLAQVTITQNESDLTLSELYNDGKEIRRPIAHQELEKGEIPLTALKETPRSLKKGSKNWALITGTVMNWTNLKCSSSL